MNIRQFSVVSMLLLACAVAVSATPEVTGLSPSILPLGKQVDITITGNADFQQLTRPSTTAAPATTATNNGTVSTSAAATTQAPSATTAANNNGTAVATTAPTTTASNSTSRRLLSTPSEWTVSIGGISASVTAVNSGSSVVAQVTLPSSTTAGSKALSITHSGTQIAVASALSFDVQKTSPPMKLTMPGTVETFVQTDFKTTMQRLLGLESIQQVHIISVSAGSVVVDFVIVNTATQQTVAETATASVEKLAEDGTLSKELGATGLEVDGKKVTVKDSSEDDGPSAGLIAGVVVGVIGGLLVMAGMIWLCNKRALKQQHSTPDMSGGASHAVV